MHKAEALQFGFVDQIQAPAKSGPVAAFRERYRDALEIQQRTGGIIPQILAATILGLSRQRVGQLVESGDLASVMVHQTRFVTMNSLIEFGEKERKRGRPLKRPSLGDQVKGAVEFGKEVYQAGRERPKKA